MTKVALVSPAPVDAYPPVAAQATILARAGHRVHLLTSARAGASAVTFSCPGVLVESFATQARHPLLRRAGFAQLALRLAALRCAGIELEIDYDPAGVVAGLWARRFGGRLPRVLVHHHHEVFFPDEVNRQIRPARLALGKADLVVVADEGRAALMEAADTAPRRIVTVWNTPLAETALAAPATRRTPFSVVYFGSIGRDHAIDTAIRSMPRWPSEARLHVYGVAPATYHAELVGLADELGVAERVVFEGWLPAERLIRTIAEYHLALTLLRPLNENLRFCTGASNKRFLAMAAGLPQVSDDGVGVRALVEGNGVGTCVSPDDPEALGTAIAAYAANPSRVEAEGARGRALIAETLNYEREFAPVLAFAFGTDDNRPSIGTGAACRCAGGPT